MSAAKTVLKTLVQNIPALNQLLFVKGAMKGHFYSPVPSLQELRSRHKSIFGSHPTEILGVDLHESEQLRLSLELIERFYAEQTFSNEFLSTGQFTWCDAITLYAVIRYFRPKRVIEIGSGRSSLVTLQTNAQFFNNSIACTLIEPFPSAELRNAVQAHPNVQLIQKRAQDVTLDQVEQLDSGDIFFVDSSHVSKVGSDVNHIVFEILPRLRPGVMVHFHDIFYPFEYPPEWIFEGRAWNEAYLLRAFLQFNPTYTIRLWMNYLIRFHREVFENRAPRLLNDPGASIWLQRSPV